MVDVDIRGYFDNIDHGRLMDLVSERVSDGEVLRLLQLWLDAEIVTEVESWNPIKGTPQGAVISPLVGKYLSFWARRSYDRAWLPYGALRR